MEPRHTHSVFVLIFSSTDVTDAQSRLKPTPSSMQGSELSSVEFVYSFLFPRNIQITFWLSQDSRIMVAIIYLSFAFQYFLNFQ